MGVNRVTLAALRCLACSALLFAWIPAGRSQTVNLSGRYQCVQAKMQGKVVPCTSALLTLKNDGRFELRGWEGSYLVEGQWVELSDSLTKARAKIEPGHKIMLRYFGKHGWVEVTYERRVADLGKRALG